MTGAAAVVWFLGKHPKNTRLKVESVMLEKPEGRVEAEQAVRESAARSSAITRQRAAVSRVVHSLAEIRENNHFADKIRTAMGGDE